MPIICSLLVITDFCNDILVDIMDDKFKEMQRILYTFYWKKPLLEKSGNTSLQDEYFKNEREV